VENRDQFIDTPRGQFHVIDWGGPEGQPLALIDHATGFCAGMYAPLAELLRPHLRVVGLDDRGHGRTRAPADPRRLKNWFTFADDLAGVIETRGEPVVMIGHSRSGTAGVFTAVRRPELIQALILLDPTILPWGWMGWWWLAKKVGLARRVPIAHRAARRRAVWPDRTTMLAAYDGKSAFKDWRPGWLTAYVAQCTEPDPGGKIRLSCDPAWEARAFAVCSHEVWRYVPRIGCPTLLLYGDRSDTFRPAAARRFARIAPEAEVVALTDTSHFVPMERPEECRDRIFDFLRRHGVLDF
jgi:pimeloyl-ACP methyl ester carboxylesterase